MSHSIQNNLKPGENTHLLPEIAAKDTPEPKIHDLSKKLLSPIQSSEDRPKIGLVTRMQATPGPLSVDLTSNAAKNTIEGPTTQKTSQANPFSNKMVTPKAPPEKIVLSSPSIYQDIQVKLPQTKFHLDPSADDAHVWQRDNRVTLLDGTHLIPYPVDSDLNKNLHPESGGGFQQEERHIAIKTAETQGIPYRRSRATLEGGNCFVFRDKDGIPKAIIGQNSIRLTALALMEQIPSACTFLDQWDKLAQKVIAEELEIPLSNIAFIPQTDFHIDMEMFIDPSKNCAYVHSNEATYNALLPDFNQNATKFYYAITQCALFETSKEDQIKTELSKIGFNTHFVPGIFKPEVALTINFMNCIRDENNNLITFDIHEEDKEYNCLREFFVKEMEKHNQSFLFLPGPYMITMITDNDGGLHCCTWEDKGAQTTPANIVMNYLEYEKAQEQSDPKESFIAPAPLRNTIREFVP